MSTTHPTPRRVPMSNDPTRVDSRAARDRRGVPLGPRGRAPRHRPARPRHGGARPALRRGGRARSPPTAGSSTPRTTAATAPPCVDGAGAGRDRGRRGGPSWSRDIGRLGDVARAAHPGLPLVLVGHSMGSFASQQHVLDHSRDVDALVLTGTGGDRPARARARPRRARSTCRPSTRRSRRRAPTSTGSAATRPRWTPTSPTRCAASGWTPSRGQADVPGGARGWPTPTRLAGGPQGPAGAHHRRRARPGRRRRRARHGAGRPAGGRRARRRHAGRLAGRAARGVQRDRPRRGRAEMVQWIDAKVGG